MESVQSAAVVKPKWLAVGAVAVLLGLVFRSAWVTEDAYITLRTIDNWVHGYGLRWNTDERVQAYTHPLWMFVLTAGYVITRESFFTTIVIGLGTTLLALLMLVRCARTAMHGATAVLLLILSISFVQFSTSGLENPLTHLLLAVFVYQYLVQRDDDVMTLSMTAGLLALNRPDALLPVLPALAHAAWLAYAKRGAKPVLRDLARGFAPLIAWELFSLFYYGFLFPNTAYAKLNTGLPRDEVLRQGLTYLINAAAWDSVALVIIALGVALGVSSGRLRERLLTVGLLLNVLYIVWIGGDFMAGRFLTAPLFLAVLLVATSELPLEDPARAAVVFLPFLFFFWHPAALEKYPATDWQHTGVADERGWYRDAQLLTFSRSHGLPAHGWVFDGLGLKERKESGAQRENVGFVGFFAGPDVHIIDTLALADPLLARLPMMYSKTWRVGHYSRKLPDGYARTTVVGKCVMLDKKLCEYYDKLRLVTAGDLWSWQRFKTIVGFQFGRYDHLIDRESFRHPSMSMARANDLRVGVGENAMWNAPGTVTFSADGLKIDLGGASHVRSLRAMLDGNDEYTFEFRHGGNVLDRVVSPALPHGLMHQRQLQVPERAWQPGFDNILVIPGAGDGMYSIADLRLGK